MELEAILEKLKKLEYHQSLMVKMIHSSSENFYKLVIEKSVGEEEVNRFLKECDRMSNMLEEQKADGFVIFQPLYTQFKQIIPTALVAEEVIPACITQGLYVPLMTELKKYL